MRKWWRFFWIGFTLFLFGGFLYSAWRWHTVAAVQRSLERNYEIDFNDGRCPAAMPEVFDRNLTKGLHWLERRTIPRKSRTQGAIQERVRMIFRGRIRIIRIYFPEGIDENLGSALENFPNLEELFFEEPAYEREHFERVIPPLFDSLGKLKRLRKLRVYGSWFGIEQFREIAEWESLEVLELEDCRVPEGLLEELIQAPKLRSLTLLDIRHDRELTEQEQRLKTKFDPYSGSGGWNDPRDWEPSPEDLRRLSEAGITLKAD